MTTTQAELNAFLEDMHHSDVVRGMFMVFDALLQGFTLSENYNYLLDKKTKEESLSVVSKVASLSNGIFHLAKYQDSDDIWFIVGHIHEGQMTSGYNLEEITDLVVDEYYHPCGEFGDEDADNEYLGGGMYEDPTIFVTKWQNHITPSLEDIAKLKPVLIKICNTLQHHEEFLLEFGDNYGFTGLAAHKLENDDYTDENLETLFKVFIERINQDVIPKLDV